MPDDLYVLLPHKLWNDYTWAAIGVALNRPGATPESVRAEIKPILDLVAVSYTATNKQIVEGMKAPI